MHSNPAFCTVCGSALKPVISGDKNLTLVEGHEPSKEAIQFSIGTYQILSSIGKGGMGEVFLAYDTATGRKLALKKVRSDLLKHPQIKGRFLREARITCQLTHPSIIPIYGISQEGDEIYYTMPFVEGENLKQILRRARRLEKQGDKSDASIASLIRIFISICQAIAYAHSKQVLHRDLKPENIIVGKYGEALILDWGLSKLSESKEEDLPNIDSKETRAGKVVGTLSYLSPERALGREASIKSDIYALGVILYQILTLKMPFNRPSLKEFRKNLPTESLIDPIEAAPYREVPRVLSQICMKMLDRDPAKRYPNLNALLHDLENYIEGRAEFYPAATLHVEEKSDWEFQENVLISEQFAITRGIDANWFHLMISRQSFAENLKIEVVFKIGVDSKGVGFLLNIPEASERKSITEGFLLWLSTAQDEPSKLLRSNVEVMTLPELHLIPGKRYDLKIEKIDKRLNVFLNNELELSYVSYIPETGTHVGFLSRDFDYGIEKFIVSEGSQNVLVSCLAVPDAFLAQKEFDKALSEYRRIAYSFPGRSEGREAAFRAGVTLMEQAMETQEKELAMKRFDLALEEFEKLKKTAAAPLEYLGKALVYHALRDTEEELKCFEISLRRDPKHPLNYILEEQILFRTYESLAIDRKTAYAFLLIILHLLPKLGASHAVLRIINNLVTHAEPIYFIEWEKKLRNDPRQISILLAYWLNKPFTLYEILSKLEASEKTLINNALYALRILDKDLFEDILIKKGFVFDQNSQEEREQIYRLSMKLDEGKADEVIEALQVSPLTVPLSCLKIQAYLLKKDIHQAGIE
ncbi:MAG: protein kinase domain-containing protein, partial [Parachlamydiaceae bacterium]